MKRMRLMAPKLLRKKNVDPANPAESLLPYQTIVPHGTLNYMPYEVHVLSIWRPYHVFTSGPVSDCQDLGRPDDGIL